MTESLRRRASKWDVVVEPQVPVKQTDAPLKVDDSGEDSTLNSDWNYSKCDSSTFSLPSEMKDDPTIMSNESSGTGKLTELLQRENDNARLPKAHSPNPDFPKPPDMDAGDGDYLKYSHKEPLFDHTAGKDDFSKTRDKWNKSPEQNHVTCLSPSRNAWRQRSVAISPKRSWSRSRRFSLDQILVPLPGRELYSLCFNKFSILFQDLGIQLEKLCTAEGDLLLCASAQENREQKPNN